MTLQEQIKVAVDSVSALFKGQVPYSQMDPPENATIADLWEEVISLRKELDALKRLKRGVKPKVEDAVKAILEDERLAEISIPLIADIVRKVFHKYEVKCDCSERSVRWYMSQRNLTWNIVRRKLPKPQIEIEEESPNEGDPGSQQGV